MKATPACPDMARLALLRDGDLPKAETSRLVLHISECPQCRAVFQKLANSAGEADVHADPNMELDTSEPPSMARDAEAVTMALPDDPTPNDADPVPLLGQEWQACLSPARTPGTLGRLGEYDILELIGQGGMGVVLKALDPRLQRVVAIKLLAPALASSEDARRRFVREARAAAAVRDTHVVSIYKVDSSGTMPYLVMEFIAGNSLDQRLKPGQPLDVKEIIRIGIQIAQGLAAAHKEGLVHRDIKPGNILLENGTGNVKITDFGLARALDDASITKSGVIAGTPLFMAPEQARGDTVDHRADLFSLGSVLYAMCTGLSPFRASNSMAVLHRVCDEIPRPIRQVNARVPDGLCAIIDKLHAKDPDDRYASAKAVIEALRQLTRPSRPAPMAQTDDRLLQKTFVERPPVPPRTPNQQAEGPQPGHNWALIVTVGGLLLGAFLMVVAVMIPLSIWWWSHDTDVAAPPAPAPQPIANPNPVKPPEKENPPEKPVKPASPPVAADGLKRDAIPQEFLKQAGGGVAASAPAELVAVFGFGEFLPFNTAAVHSLAISPNGQLLAVGQGPTARVWNLANGKLVCSLPQGQGTTHHENLVFSPDSSLLATRSKTPNNILLHDANSGLSLRSIAASVSTSSIVFSPDGQVIATAGSGEAMRWKLTGEWLNGFKTGTAKVTYVESFSPNGAWLAANGSKMVWVLDAGTGAIHKSFATASANGLPRFSLDGKTFAFNDFKNSNYRVRLMDVATWTELETSPETLRDFRAFALHPSRRLVAFTPSDGTVRLWETAQGQQRMATFRPGAFGKQARRLAFTPEGRYLAVGGDNGAVALFRVPETLAPLADNPPLPKSIPLPPPATNFQGIPLPDRFVLANTPSAADNFQRQNIPFDVLNRLGTGFGDAPKELVAVLGKSGDPQIVSLSLTKDGRTLATGSIQGTKALLYNLANGQLAKTLSLVDKKGNLVAIHPNGTTVAMTGDRSTCEVVNVADSRIVATIHTSLATKNALDVVYSPDGSQVCISDGNARVVVRHVLNGGERTFDGHTKEVTKVAFSPDGKYLASSGGTTADNQEIIVRSLATGDILGRLKGHTAAAWGLAWHPNGKMLASAGRDGSIRIWDLQKMKEVQLLRGADNEIQSLAWHPNGDFLASNAHTTGNITLWDLRVTPARPRVIHLFPADDASRKSDRYNNDVLFTPEGRHLIGANSDGTISVLRLAELGKMVE